MNAPNWRMREILEQIFRAGLEAVAGHAVVRRSLQCDGDGNLTALSLTGETARLSGIGRMPLKILSMGKAAASMVDGLPEPLTGATQQGLIVCNEAVSPRDARFTSLLGGHPEPTKASWMAGRAAAALVRTMSHGELLVLLLSGGASSLSFYPPPRGPPGHRSHPYECGGCADSSGVERGQRGGPRAVTLLPDSALPHEPEPCLRSESILQRSAGNDVGSLCQQRRVDPEIQVHSAQSETQPETHVCGGA